VPGDEAPPPGKNSARHRPPRPGRGVRVADPRGAHGRFTYEQVAERLERRIKSGEFDGSGKLPSQRELCAYYGAGPGAVRHVMRELKSRGLVYFIPFKGTFLALPQESTRSYRTAGRSFPQDGGRATAENAPFSLR
jgi:GntR family transcriptional regulator